MKLTFNFSAKDFQFELVYPQISPHPISTITFQVAVSSPVSPTQNHIYVLSVSLPQLGHSYFQAPPFLALTTVVASALMSCFCSGLFTAEQLKEIRKCKLLFA